MKQHEILLRVLEDSGEWTPSHQLIKMETDYGFLGTSADRVARKLAEEGKIERRHEGKFASYRIRKEKSNGQLFEFIKMF